MRITAHVSNGENHHTATVATDGRQQTLNISPGPTGFGSSVNGGELLFLALATCYCNDLYREAKARGIVLHGVEVEVTGDFGGRGLPATGISYRARVQGDASAADLQRLMDETDAVAEIQNTVRQGCPVTFAGVIS